MTDKNQDDLELLFEDHSKLLSVCPSPLGSLGLRYHVKTQGSAGPVFPQLGLEPNHAGLTAQSLFLLEELLCRVKRSGTLNVLKLLKLFKKSSKLSRTSPNKTSFSSNSQITYQTPTNSFQNNMFLRHGSNNIQKHQKPTKNEKSTSKLFHAQTGSTWFKLVPTWFLRGSCLVPRVFEVQM